MRISDWSSDVCSSDLVHSNRWARKASRGMRSSDEALLSNRLRRSSRSSRDRKSVVKGKSVSVRVDLGGGRIINKSIVLDLVHKKVNTVRLDIQHHEHHKSVAARYAIYPLRQNI